jgi:hypothetical protein
MGSAGTCFVAYDGTLSWPSGDAVIESSFETVLTAREASGRYRTAISADLIPSPGRIARRRSNSGAATLSVWSNRSKSPAT